MKTRLLTLIILLLTSLFHLTAQTHPATERGYRPELAYDVNSFDTINLMNGNLLAAIPVGQAYPVGEGLSYAVTLRYTGNLWQQIEKPNIFDPTQPPKIRYLPRRDDNAGLGWRIGFGELFSGVTTDPGEYNAAAAKWRYVTPDGSEHLFWETLHEPQCIAPTVTNCDTVDSGVLYSRDNSYLRLRFVGTNVRIIEFPNGQRHRFALNTTTSPGGWRIESMYTAASTLDASGIPTTNYVKFEYIANATSGGIDWKITDSHTREHWIRRSSSGRINSMEMKAVGGATATYTPVYQTHTIRKPCHESDELFVTIALEFLTRFDLPAASAEKWSFEYELPTTACSDTSATMTRATVPAGGQVGWTYVSNASEEMPTALAVSHRSLYDNSIPRVEVARKVYGVGVETHVNIGTAASPVWRADKRTIEHRMLLWGPTYGLPITTTSRTGVAPNPDATGRYLSSETFDCDPVAGTCSTIPDRATYVKYEMDEKIGGGCTVFDPCQIERNRRVVSERTLFVSDGGRYFDRNFSRFDGLGHYRQTDTTGTFDAGNIRRTTTEYNPGTGNYAVDSSGNRLAGFTMISAATPWLLETYTETSSVEASVTERQQHCFSATTGLLLRQRVLYGSTSPASNDLLKVYTRATGTGHVTREQRYGGDTQALGTGVLCSLTLPSTDQFRLDKVWQYGVLNSSRYFSSAGTALPFYNEQNTIDLSTGLVTTSRDTSGLGTSYQYDILGRIIWAIPVSGGRTETVYTPATATTPPQVEVREWNSNATVLMGKSQWLFDSLHRLSKEKRLLSNGTWSTRKHVYDTAGRKSFVSEAEGVAEPVNGTTMRNFDPYDRPGEVVAADGKITSYVYRGVRQVDRTVAVRTGGTVAAPLYTNSLTTETYDAQGRLWRVAEQSGASGASVTSTYTYDQGSRVKRVQMTGAEGTQNRYFNYDRRGLLTSEQHPEKGTSGNGLVTYGLYNASGQYGQRIDGAFDLRYTYDRAGRLIDISEGSGRTWKTFVYGAGNGTTPEGFPDRRLGKLWSSTRHNHIDRFGMDITMTEMLTYAGVGGLVSRRDTTSSDATAFTQTYAYDDRGKPVSIGYPVCTADCPHGTNLAVTNTYTNGFLTAVPGYASSITYHPNGLTAGVTFANLAQWVQANDPNSMVRPLSISTSNTTSNWVSGDYKYDAAGNIISIGQDLYWYDQVSRLRKGSTLAGTAVQDYTWDSFGNVTSITTTRSGIVTPRTISASAATNRLTTSTYDASGNVTAHGSDVYEYDPLGMVRAVHDPAFTSKDWIYLYTPSDERIWSFNYIANTSYWRVRGLDGKVLTEMVNAADNWSSVTSYVYREGGKLLASHSAQRSWPTRWYAVDHLGTPRQILNSNRSILALHSYYPFGEEATSTTADGDVMKFTGHERDFCCNGTGEYVDYMRARFYAPFAARFLAPDLHPGVPNKPQSWNRYTYAFGNPVSFTDPSGLWPTWTHNRMLETTFKGLGTRHLETLQRASKYVDRYSNQGVENSYQHGMRAPGQSVADAQALAATFYTDMIGAAKTARANGDLNQAYFALGQALHLVMDMTSPTHRGFQEWNENKAAQVAHVLLELRKPTRDEMNMVSAMLLAAFAEVFGVELADEVAKGPRPPEPTIMYTFPGGPGPTTADGGTILWCIDGACW
jgi:RHS repeat-associated protein